MKSSVVVRPLASGILVLLSLFGYNSDSLAAGAPEVASQPVGLIQIPVNPGANFISAPLHRIHSYRGVVADVTAGSIGVAGNPTWTTDHFAPVQGGFRQFVVIVRKCTLPGSTHEGDWWPVLSNTSNSLTVDTRNENLTAILQPGDHIEVRHLTTIKDLFGTGSSAVLNKDSDGLASVGQEDVIRFVAGTGFSTEIFYHDGTLAPEGYYVNGEGPYDGSTLTLWPDQAITLFRKSGSPLVNLKVLGQVQMTPLTHYLQPAANCIGTGFAVAAPIGLSGLFEAGWVGDDNGLGSVTEEHLIRTVVGTGYDKEIFYHNGSLADPGWYVNGEWNNAFPLEPGKGYFFFIKGASPLRWPQALP